MVPLEGDAHTASPQLPQRSPAKGGAGSNKGPEACVPLSRSFQQLGKACPMGSLRPTVLT